MWWWGREIGPASCAPSACRSLRKHRPLPRWSSDILLLAVCTGIRQRDGARGNCCATLSLYRTTPRFILPTHCHLPLHHLFNLHDFIFFLGLFDCLIFIQWERIERVFFFFNPSVLSSPHVSLERKIFFLRTSPRIGFWVLIFFAGDCIRSKSKVCTYCLSCYSICECFWIAVLLDASFKRHQIS